MTIVLDSSTRAWAETKRKAPPALDDVDFAAIQSNFAIYSGLKLTNAFALGKMTTPGSMLSL